MMSQEKKAGGGKMRWEEGDEKRSVHVWRGDVDVSVIERAEKAVGGLVVLLLVIGRFIRRLLLLWIVSLFG